MIDFGSGLKERYRGLASFFEKAIYQKIRLVGSVNLSEDYQTDKTPLQKFIENNITNGRGYMPLGAAINYVNSATSGEKIDLTDALASGLVPICLSEFDNDMGHLRNNPCNEVTFLILPPLERSPMIPSEEQPTLVDRLIDIRRSKNVKIAGSYTRSPFPIDPIDSKLYRFGSALVAEA